MAHVKRAPAGVLFHVEQGVILIICLGVGDDLQRSNIRKVKNLKSPAYDKTLVLDEKDGFEKNK